MRAVRVGPPRAGLRGIATVPGDKSLAHRALLLGALADGMTEVTHFSGGADVLSTLGAIRTLGAHAELSGTTVRITGRGTALGGADVALDCGNSGTTMRLGAGLVAGGKGVVTLDGDASLRRRPMERVAAPLRAMRARVDTTDGHAPLVVAGGALTAVDWTLPVASAQVKSAVLLAGLRARGTTRVREPLASRDHTERMLGHFGVRVVRDGTAVAVDGGQQLRAAAVPLPGDPSSAAFLIVAALLAGGSEIVVRDVGLNPTRTGAFGVLDRMGAHVTTADRRDIAGEPWGTLGASAAMLRGVTIGADDVPAAIDELPVLCVAAALAEGETVVSGAAELRFKESDRIAALEQLRLCGVEVDTRPDGLTIRGTAGRPLRGARIDPRGDHRIAMAFAVAGVASVGGIEITDPGCVDVSFPGFFETLARLGATVEAA